MGEKYQQLYVRRCYESFDGANVCELIGLFALNTLANKFGKENIGL